MRIGFDARFSAVPGGLGRYCTQLISHLAARYPDDQFTVLAPTLPELMRRPNIRHIRCTIPWYGIEEQTKLGLLMNSQRDVDLWHIPHWNVPLLLLAPFVMTIHDFIAEQYPTHNGVLDRFVIYHLKRAVWRLLLWRNVRRARGIITVSHTVRDELVRRFPSAAQKTVVIHNGVSLPPAPAQTPPPTHPFFLIVGNSYPHKNHDLVFRAFAQCAATDQNTHLYVITHEDRFSRAAADAVARGAAADRIHFLFNASDGELAYRYHHALALIFPSLTEGFGIPPLEALQAGTPVFAVRNTINTEILNDFAQWIDPDDHNALAQHLCNFVAEPARATAAAQQHAFQFTWDRVAVRTMEVYATILKQQ